MLVSSVPSPLPYLVSQYAISHLQHILHTDASITSLQKSAISFCFKTFLMAPRLLLMKLYSIYKVKNASPSPAQAAAEPEPAQSIPIPAPVLSFFYPCYRGGKLDFGGEGYTIWVFLKTQSMRLIPSIFSNQCKSHCNRYRNWQNMGHRAKRKALHGQRI